MSNRHSQESRCTYRRICRGDTDIAPWANSGGRFRPPWRWLVVATTPRAYFLPDMWTAARTASDRAPLRAGPPLRQVTH
eukprot:CAMPEP_0172706834 /NCGR_PEP_ID=MMETSP1074-20121228/47289_1 /TAXON_ID=2916 /ORGANISM="Ceratium fusus, Strain PA161109" /LENGTH=78 /DNA_ID=CAMNT_0013529503 /DNA_START=74 /DNA_END=310 /DNA_ORIENTATION=+